MQVYQRFDVDVPPAYNFIKNETPTHVFPYEFWEFFNLGTLIKRRLQHRCFVGSADFEKFLSLQLY